MLTIEDGPHAASGKYRVESIESRIHQLLRVGCHDLCTPLAAIRMHVQRALLTLQAGQQMSPEQLIELLKRVDRIAGDGARLVEDVLAVERLEKLTPELVPEIDLETILASTVSMHAEALRRANCEILVERARDFERVRGHWHAGAAKSLFSNLLQNVARHAAGATVRVSFARSGQGVHIRFADNGPGLPSPFPALRSGSTKPRPTIDESHGLGIWIIHQAVAELGGDINMRNRPEGGLDCDIWLPL
jgi:signal transduction histidine kinase